MKRISVLIIDDNRLWCDSLVLELQKVPAFEILKPIHSGANALEEIMRLKPDVLVMDILLPEYDGLYILSAMQKQAGTYAPVIYVISVLAVENSKVLNSLQVSHYSLKPITVEAVVGNIKWLLNGMQSPKNDAVPGSGADLAGIDIERYIDQYLFDLGAPLFRISTNCGQAAIKQALLDESMLTKITEIYKIVGVGQDLTAGAVERNIRSMVKYIRGKDNSYFRSCFEDCSNKLSNSEFISASVYILRRRIEGGLQ